MEQVGLVAAFTALHTNKRHSARCPRQGISPPSSSHSLLVFLPLIAPSLWVFPVCHQLNLIQLPSGCLSRGHWGGAPQVEKGWSLIISFFPHCPTAPCIAYTATSSPTNLDAMSTPLLILYQHLQLTGSVVKKKGVGRPRSSLYNGTRSLLLYQHHPVNDLDHRTHTAVSPCDHYLEQNRGAIKTSLSSHTRFT